METNQEPENKIDPLSLGLKILIVEDDETSQMLLSIELEKFAREIITAENGQEAIDLCMQNEDIDLVLMDIQLPEINGYQATKRIRKFNDELIIVSQTAYALQGDHEKSIEAGCNEYLSKPIKREELHAIIKKYFKK